MKDVISILFLLGACTFSACDISAAQVVYQQGNNNVTINGMQYNIDQVLLNVLNIAPGRQPRALNAGEFGALHYYCTGVYNTAVSNGALRAIEGGMWELLRKARAGEVYAKVGRYVGRVNIGSTCTGTGTLIQWEGMPENLKGRVVLTVLHNYVDEKNLNDLKNKASLKCNDVLYFNKGEIKDALKGQVGVTEEDRPLTFMTDLSDNQNDIITYQPGIHTDNNGKHKVYDIEKVCAFIDDQGNIIDAALFFLNEPATDQNGRMEGTQIDGAEESVSGNQYYSIGYGDPTDKQSIGWGWNTKKATITSSIDDSDNQRFLCLNIPSGHSQSGAPLVSEKHNKIVGVYEGGFATKISSIFDQITVFAALYDAGELK